MSEHGAWGSSVHHKRYMEPVDPKRRRRCSRCQRPRPRATHRGMANGVCLMTGCEWHVRVWVRDGWTQRHA